MKDAMPGLDPRKREDRLHYGWSIERRAELWFLERAPPGARTIARGFRSKVGELDLIFEVPDERGGDELVFVEVRARIAGRSWVDGVASVSYPKQRRLERTVRVFLAKYRGKASRARFDILAWDGRGWTHRRNVWLP